MEAIRELGEIKKELGEMKKERDEIKKELNGGIAKVNGDGTKKRKVTKVEGVTPKQEEVEVVAAESTNGDNSVELPMQRSDFFTRAKVNLAYSGNSNLQMSTFGGTGMKITTPLAAENKDDVGIAHLALKEEYNSSTLTNATKKNNKLQIRFFKATGQRNKSSVKRLRDSLQTEGHKKAKEPFPFFWEPLDEHPPQVGRSSVITGISNWSPLR